MENQPTPPRQTSNHTEQKSARVFFVAGMVCTTAAFIAQVSPGACLALLLATMITTHAALSK